MKSSTHKFYDDLIYNSYKNYTNVNDYIINLLNVNGFYGISNYNELFTNKHILSYYNCTPEDVRNAITNNMGDIFQYDNKYRRYKIYYNGHICRSLGEYKIAHFLKENGLNYKYEKLYPNSKRKSDFYLIDKDFYIEYAGLLTGRTGYKRADNYKIRLQEKKEMCEQNNINHFFNNDVKEIINKIEGIFGI